MSVIRLPRYEYTLHGRNPKRPTYSRVYADGMRCESFNGFDCEAKALAYIDEHDAIRKAARAGMMVEIAPCTLRPEDCPYAQREDVVCLRQAAIWLAPRRTWYFCRGQREGGNG